jgi:phosphomannomutase
MTLIKSISGIRGTIGGQPGDGLSPVDIVLFTSAFARFLKAEYGKSRIRIVVGRDARTSGEMVSQLVTGSLMGMGADVIALGLATTPTVEMAVIAEHADGGIILTASHNPGQWNALKLLNNKGEFLSAADGEKLLGFAEEGNFDYSGIDHIGHLTEGHNYNHYHIEKILSLPAVNKQAIKNASFKIAVDAVNSVGGIIVPELLEALGVKQVVRLYCEPNGRFPHNPEPLPEHLSEIAELIRKEKCNAGFVVDPDVDRLAIVNEDGSMFGEEYTLVAVADYILKKAKGNTVSNLSSTRALRDVTESYGGSYFAAAVGEVNVVEQMKASNAVIGGEGNGGIIYPPLHYGRDALVGIALFLTHLAESGLTSSALRRKYPEYFMSKNKIQLEKGANPDLILEKMKQKYSHLPHNNSDGLRIDFEKEWVHMRKSNTEPIIRIYSESGSMEAAQTLANRFVDEIKTLVI